ncbi:MAG: restriction endonuclease subunit S [Acidimicrobiales bacterium]
MTKLPAGWAWASIGELALQGGITDGPFGSNLKTEHYTASGPRVVRLKNIGDGIFNDELAHISPDHFARLAKHSVEPGDVLVASLGEILPRACIAPDFLGPAIVKADCIRIRPHGNVLSKYLMLALNSPDVRRRVGESIKGVGRPRVNLGDLRALQLPVAPLDEQRRIVAAIEEAFSKLDAGEAGLRRVRQLLKRMRDSILAAAVTGRLVPQDPADTPAAKLLAEVGTEMVETQDGPAELPASWAVTQLGGLLARPLANGRSVRTQPGGFPVLRLTCLRDGRINLRERKSGEWDSDDAAAYLVQRGDFLVSRGNGSLALVGRGGLVDADPDPVAYPDTLIRVRVLEAVLSPSWLAMVWNSAVVRRQLEVQARTTAGIYKVNQSMIADVKLPIPPREEQGRIVAEVDRQLSSLDACGRAADAGLARAAALRRSVLKAAFEGRLVPQDPSDEPASALLERIRAERVVAPEPKRTRASSGQCLTPSLPSGA